MGRETAAIAVAIVSAKPAAEHFRSTPGGYFHGMVAKAPRIEPWADDLGLAPGGSPETPPRYIPADPVVPGARQEADRRIQISPKSARGPGPLAWHKAECHQREGASDENKPAGTGFGPPEIELAAGSFFLVTIPAISLGHSVANGLRCRFELMRQVVRIASGADQINHLTPKLRRIGWAGLGHKETPLAKASGCPPTAASPDQAVRLWRWGAGLPLRTSVAGAGRIPGPSHPTSLRNPPPPASSHRRW
jgi:hypothetical protein